MNGVVHKRPAPGAAAGDVLPLFLLTLGALLIRLFRLDGQSLWIDECVTVSRAAWDLGKTFLFSSYTPPLHHAFLHYWLMLGHSDFWVRLPSAVAGALCVPLTFLAARSLLEEASPTTRHPGGSGCGGSEGRAASWYAAVITAVAPLHIYYSQEAKPYSLTMLLGLLSVYGFLEIMRGGGDGNRGARPWVLYLASTSLGIATHYSVVYVLVLENVWFFFGPGRRAVRTRNWLLAQAFLFAAVVLPLWVFHFLPTTRMVQGALPGVLRRPFQPLAIPYFFYAFSVGFSFGPSLADLHTVPAAVLIRSHLPALGLTAVAFSLAFLSGLVRMRPRRAALFLASWILLPLGLSLLASLKVGTIVHVRFAIVVLPAYVMILAAGVAALRAPWLRGALLAGLLALCLWSDRQYFFDPAYWREDARGAAAMIAKREQKNDVIAGVSSYFMRHAFSYYYRGGCRLVTFPFDTMADEENVRDLAARDIGDAPRVWYVQSRQWETDPTGLLKGYLDAHFRVEESAELPGVQVILYTRAGGG